MEDARQYIHNCKRINSVLKTKKEVLWSINQLKKLKLNLHQFPKNWDSYRIFSFILKYGHKNSLILDVGSGKHSIILSWLELYGFSKLYACDISLQTDYRKGKINYYRQNLEKTNFPSNVFDIIISISVVEHGIELDRYLAEMSRLLKPGGYLLTSTDYWPTSIDTRNIFPYGKKFGEMKIFNRTGIEEIIRKAEKYQFKLIKPIDWTHKEKVVSWKRLSKKFTFILFVMQKE